MLFSGTIKDEDEENDKKGGTSRGALALDIMKSSLINYVIASLG